MSDFEDFVPSAAKVAPVLVARGFERTATIARFLMLGVHGKAVVRKSWSNDAEVSQTMFDRLRKLPEIEPDLDRTAPREHRSLDVASAHAQQAPCRQCFTKKGREQCHACAGTGRIATSGDETKPCTACDAGWIACAACDGTGIALKVRIHYHEDRVVTFARAFVPESTRRFQQGLTRFLGERSEIPECLSFDLSEELATRDAYRGRTTESEYRGHVLGNAREAARRYLERVERLPSVLKVGARCYAWPFGVVSEDVRAVVILVDDRGRTTML